MQAFDQPLSGTTAAEVDEARAHDRRAHDDHATGTDEGIDALLAALCATCAGFDDNDWHGPSPGAWRAAVETVLADPRLADAGARAAFEAELVRRLADGWRPGHDVLFCVAPAIFDWDAEPARLHALGAPGARLLAAMAEQQAFEQQSDRLRFLQRYLMGRLRRPGEPDAAELLYRVPHAVHMARRFPAWTAIVTDHAALARWIARYRQLPKARPLPALDAPGDWSPDVESNRALAAIALATIVVLATIAYVSRLGEPRGPRPRPQMVFQNVEPVPASAASVAGNAH